MEPWRGLGYDADGLEKFLRQAASSGQVWVASVARPAARKPTLGLLVLQPNVLLGNFVSLLAVQPGAAGQGIGRALMSRAQAETFAARRWLFVSADAQNRDALGFYRHLGFTRVGRLPDLVRDGRTELLLRQGRRPQNNKEQGAV